MILRIDNQNLVDNDDSASLYKEYENRDYVVYLSFDAKNLFIWRMEVI